MAGFGDLVGRNAPALGVNRAAYVAGDTWGDSIGVFTDNDGAAINMAAANITISIYDRPGGSVLQAFQATGTTGGLINWTLNSATTANLAAGQQRNLFWNCVAVAGGSTVTVWSAVESPLTVLID